MKNIIIITLLIIASNLQINAQKEDYIHLLDTGKVWTEAMLTEFNDIAIFGYHIGNRVVYNDTLYFEIFSNDRSSMPRYLREDTIEHKVYNSWESYSDDQETLLYDFSLEVGDSIDGVNWPIKLYLDSIKNINYFGINRRTYYFHEKEYEIWGDDTFNPIWVEGLGSLAGFFQVDNLPNLDGTGQTELNCLHQNDEMIYQSNNASIFGCNFEIDPYPPYYEQAWVGANMADVDTIDINGHMSIHVIASDASDFTITATFTSPDGTEYYYSDFTHYPYNSNSTIVTDFHNQIGDWYLSKVVLEDDQNNITEHTFSSNDQLIMFYVKEPIDVKSIEKQGVTIQPNPSQGIFTIKNMQAFQNPCELSIINISGKQIFNNQSRDKYGTGHSINNNQLKIDISNFPKGIYFLTISNKNYNEIQKIIIH